MVDSGGDVRVSGNDAVRAFEVGRGAELTLRNLVVSGGNSASEGDPAVTRAGFTDGGYNID